MKEKDDLINKINNATLVSFDVFDTLIFRKTNNPETIFEIIGKNYDIPNFKKLRIDAQNEASRRIYAKSKYPHANIDEIYEVLAENKDYLLDWKEVQKYEIQLEKDAIVVNDEMLEIFKYAKSIGKRIVAITDMYLFANTIDEILKENGFVGFDNIYCSADEHKAKFNKELFEYVVKKENVDYKDVLHIGDKSRDDGEFPESFGINTFIYNREVDLEKVSKATASDVDNGLYKILYNPQKSFMYNLGMEIGGPLYTALFLWFSEKIKNTNKKVFFLSRDGYNLYNIFKEKGYHNIEYLYTSRRALLLAGITEMNESDISILPPFTKGQTIKEILNYLLIPLDKITCLNEIGFKSFDDKIITDEDMKNFKKMYILNRDVFLERCKFERENAIKYFKNVGLLDEDAIVFDCGWNGSSQELLDRFKRAIGCNYSNYFYYFGIVNSQKARTQMRKKHYDTYIFDFYKNYTLQKCVNDAVAMFELFFSAPHQSVFYYSPNNIVFEEGNDDEWKIQMLEGIKDYLRIGIPFIEKYNIEYTPETAIGHIERLIKYPTQEEAITIGNINNVDGFAKQDGVEKYIAYVTEEQFDENPNIEIYWMEGLLKRPDISERLKKKIAKKRGIIYPKKEESEYHLEAEQNIINYYRWIENHENDDKEKVQKLQYEPKFSVVIPVYNTVTEQLTEAIDSVLAQSYDNYELILVDDHSSWENVVPVLKQYEENKHVKVIYRQTNGHISVATNDGINIATGDYIVFMDCDDWIESNALYEFAKKINENPELDFIYSDEDKITEDGKIRHMPFFKPDWSPDMFMSMMYTNHLAVYRLSKVKQIGGLRTAYNGSQDYDMTLRLMEISDNKKVGHIPKILYHWRERKESVAYAMNSKNYATEASGLAKKDALKRRSISGHIEYITGMNQYRIVYDPVGNPLVSIIIPSKDHFNILKQCIDSIKDFTEYLNYEIIVVDNGSSEKHKVKIANYLEEKNAKYIYQPSEFNFSKMCNIGAKASKGEYLLFLNDDIEIFQGDWLTRLVGQAEQKHTGAVGVKLFYPNSTIIQHSGVSNIMEGPSHNYMYLDDSFIHGFGYNWIDYNTIAVTAACLLINKKIFIKVGGFDESFPIAYNDVDLCFKIYEAGYYNVVRNDVRAYHHESLSRGIDDGDDSKMLRLSAEKQALYCKHPNLKQTDPFLNKNLHNYSPILDLKYNYNEIIMEDISSSVQYDTQGVIDLVEISDKIRILGWSFLPEKQYNQSFKRYIILKDIYNNQYKATLNNLKRIDVVEYENNEDLLFCGFECILDKKIFSTDIMKYKIGILTVDNDGISHIFWSNISTNISLISGNNLRYSEGKMIEEESLQNSAREIAWNIDNIESNDESFFIRGWLFCDWNEHYKYKKDLILKSEDNQLMLFDVIDENRIDVAKEYCNFHFLQNSGFSCRILKKYLKQDEKYEIVLRLTNKFDNTDINNVLTEKIIKNGN